MYSDKTITCRECGQSFVFTTGEQEFFASKGFTNEPSRCPECRASRSRSRGDNYSTAGGGGYGGGGGYERREREMFPATCSQCGKATQVPFQPRTDRPVYCSDCFATQRGNSYSGGGGAGGRNRY
ncbi:MAG: zinc-binding protein [Chloroflexi bacterium]|nr:zinc-binding protein [Chloroflexota bacterium]